jgi:hypothetical protein
MQREVGDPCFPSIPPSAKGINIVSNMLDAVIFLIFIVLLIQLSRPAPLASRELKIWNDETERRLLAGLPPRNRR